MTSIYSINHTPPLSQRTKACCAQTRHIADRSLHYPVGNHPQTAISPSDLSSAAMSLVTMSIARPVQHPSQMTRLLEEQRPQPTSGAERDPNAVVPGPTCGAIRYSSDLPANQVRSCMGCCCGQSTGAVCGDGGGGRRKGSGKCLTTVSVAQAY